MTTVDFTKLRASPKSRNDSFEALVVHLFRATCQVPDGATFMSLRGDGGDGGVEAYFRAPTGEVHGVQAKYFFKLDASELAQVADSMATALLNHPTLTEYYIYIPFDLTGRVAAGRRGLSQAERFEEWKENAQIEALKDGRTLQITLCTASVIRDQLLAHDKHGGMRKYWFNEETLTRTQIDRLLESAKIHAGPRYSALLDIKTAAHDCLDMFGGIGDYNKWFANRIAPTLATIHSNINIRDKALGALNKETEQKTRELLNRIINGCRQLSSQYAPETADRTLDSLKEVAPFLTQAREICEQAFFAKHGPDADNINFRQFHSEYMCEFPAADMDVTRSLEATATQLIEALSNAELRSASSQSLLLVGPAGIGKSHAIVTAASRHLAHGGMSLVVFGDQFGKADTWEVLRSKLGFGAAMGRDELFECLQACSESTGLPFILYIDALNEGTVKTGWRQNLPELLEQLKPYKGIKVCVSTRDTYLAQVVDSTFPGQSFEHIGFAGNEFAALQAFAAHYQLDAEITPLFSPEIGNPLFLHLVCQTLVAQGKTTLDMSLPGFTKIIENHMKACDDNIRTRLHYVNPHNLVRACMLRIAGVLTEVQTHDRTWGSCIAAIKDVVGSELSPELLLNELAHEKLLIINVDERNSSSVRMGYQRYGDTLRAIHLVELCSEDGVLDRELLAPRLVALGDDESGLIDAIAVVMPEMREIEITDPLLGLSPELALTSYIRSLVSRSRKSFDFTTNDRVIEALQTGGLWMAAYEAFFSLSLVPGHILNTENWLHDHLENQRMVDRDVYLSLSAYESYNKNGAVKALLNSALNADISLWPQESLRLATWILTWLTACADRRIRDLASKGLTRILLSNPRFGSELVRIFGSINDDYIKERVCLSVYSAFLLSSSPSAEHVEALFEMVSANWQDSPNVMIRESIQMFARTMDRKITVAPALLARIESRKKWPLPARWPTPDDVKALFEIKGLPTNLNMLPDGMEPDFLRYQLDSAVFKFDLESAEISRSDIACWILLQIQSLGYPGSGECALSYDQIVTREFGSGRGRKAYAERVSKKYQWIFLHRLLAILADNVAIKTHYEDEVDNEGRYWSLDRRQVDLTDVRDIFPEKTYPDEVIRGPDYPFPPQTGDMKDWALNMDFTPHEHCIIRRSLDGVEWVMLSMNASEDDLDKKNRDWSKPRLSVQLQYRSVFISADRLGPRLFHEAMHQHHNSWDNYRGYIGEYPDGESFKQLDEESEAHLGPDGTSLGLVTFLRAGAEWEYDFSAEKKPEILYAPCPLIIRELNLSWDKQRGWVNEAGELVAFAAQFQERTGLFIKRKALNNCLLLTQNYLFYSSYTNKGLIKGMSSDGCQCSVRSQIAYKLDETPTVLATKIEPYNC